MAIVVTDRGTHQTAQGGSVTFSVTTSAMSVTAGSILVVGVHFTGTNNGSTQTFTFAGSDNIADTGGGSWTRQNTSTRGSVLNGQQIEQIETWTRIIGTSPGTSKTITFTATGDVSGTTTSTDGWGAIHVWEVTGQHASPIGNKVGNAPVTSGTTITCNLGATPAATSAVFGHVMSDFGMGVSIDPPGSWTEDDDQHPGIGTFEWAHIGASSVQSPQWSGFTSGERLLGCALEIVAAATAATESGHLDQSRLRPPGLLSPRGQLTPIGDASAAPTTSASAGTTSATAIANNGAASVAPTGGLATATATANNGAANVAPGAGSGSASATANNAALSLKPTGGLASATGTANNAALSLQTSANVGSVSATAGGGAGSVAVGPTAGSATATAYNATVQTGSFTNAAAGAGSATATAYNASCSVKTTAGVATSTATANGAAASLAPTAGAASVTCIGYTASGSVYCTAGLASVGATAYAATTSGATGTADYLVPHVIRLSRPRLRRYRRPGS